MELADFAGPRRRWADLMDEETNAVGPAAVHAAPRRRRRPPRQRRVRTLRSDADVHGNLLRLYVWLVFSGSRDVATLRCLQVYLQTNLPVEYVAPMWVFQWLWLCCFW